VSDEKRQWDLDENFDVLPERSRFCLVRNRARTPTMNYDAAADALLALQDEVEDQFVERHGPGCPPCPEPDRREHLRRLIASIRALRTVLNFHPQPRRVRGT